MSGYIDDTKLSTLMVMGFNDIEANRSALRSAKGDINEAAIILTESSYGVYDVRESGQGDELWSGNLEFPTNLAQALHARVFADSWNIPYKKNESLGQCLLAAIKMSQAGLWKSDYGLNRFCKELLPECFNKLMDAPAVRRWEPDIQSGVLDMAELLVELSVTMLQYESLMPCSGVMNALAEIMRFNCEFHYINRSKASKYITERTYAIQQSSNLDHNYGWLIDLINQFGSLGGFDALFKKLESEEATFVDYAKLFKPLPGCAKFLSNDTVWPRLQTVIQNITQKLENVSKDELKSPKADRLFWLLERMYLVCVEQWPEQTEKLVKIRLDILHSMIQLPQFFSRINALKELGHLISACEKKYLGSFDLPAFQTWMTENRVLYCALEGNLDQQQYTERMRELMELLGPKLREEDLSHIWQLVDQASSPQVVDNVHFILEMAAKGFSPAQHKHVLDLVCQSFEHASEFLQEKLLHFLGRLGQDDRLGITADTMLDVMWVLARRPELSISLVEKAMDQHLTILTYSKNKDTLRREYMERCVKDIKRSPAVYLPLKQLHMLAASYISHSHGSYKSERNVLSSICKEQQLVSLVTSSLSKCHDLSVQSAGGKPPRPSTLIDGKYTHEQYLTVHTEFLKFLLKDAQLYMPYKCAKDIWDTLVTKPLSSQFDHELCFQLLFTCLLDLEPQSQRQLLTECLMVMPPEDLTPAGYACILAYWKAINVADRNIIENSDTLTIQSLDLVGTEYFWRIFLEAANPCIVNEAANILLSLYYFDLAAFIQIRASVLHQRFIKEYHRRLEELLKDLNLNKPEQQDAGSPKSSVLNALTTATPTLTAMAVSPATDQHSQTYKALLRQIERLVTIAREYVSRVESTHKGKRTIVSHRALLHGHPLIITVKCSKPSLCFNIAAHSYESINTFKTRLFEATQQELSVKTTDGHIVDNDFFNVQHITQLAFLLSPELQVPNNTSSSSSCSSEERFSVSPSTGDSPWNYKYIASTGNASSFISSDGGGHHWKDDRSSEHAEEDELSERKGCKRVLVTCGTKKNTLLWELGIESDCTVILKTNKTSNTKIEEAASEWSELPGAQSYSDSDNNNSSSCKALVPVTEPVSSSSPVKGSSSFAGGGSILGGIFDKIQGYKGSSNTNTEASSTSTSSSYDNNYSGAAGGASGATNNTTKSSAAERSLPGVLMTDKGLGAFELLYKLGAIRDEKVMQATRQLMGVIPTDPEVLEKCGFISCNIASNSEMVANNISPHITSKDMLERLLDVSQPDMTPFKFLYILEAFCIKAIRVDIKEDSIHSKYIAEFLRLHGIELLVSLLKEEEGSPGAQLLNMCGGRTTIFRLIQYRILHLLRYMICGVNYLHFGSDEQSENMYSYNYTKINGLITHNWRVPVSAPTATGIAKATIYLMSEQQWVQLVYVVMRAAWWGAAKKLMPPVFNETDSSITECRAESPAAGASVCSGYPVIVNDPTNLDAHISAVSLTVMASCIAARSSYISCWYKIGGLGSYLLELLLGCSSNIVRSFASKVLTELTLLETSVKPHPKLFISQTLVKAPLPLWVPTSQARGSTLKTISQSHEYFKLRSSLLKNLSSDDEQLLDVSVRQMLDDELNWLTNFTPIRPRSHYRRESPAVEARKHADNILCAGHLTLIRSLITAPDINLLDYSEKLLPLITEVYLFPAAAAIKERAVRTNSKDTSKVYLTGRCCGKLSQTEAYNLLLQLSQTDSRIMASLCKRLVSLHHTLAPDAISQWELAPLVDKRADCGFVGLKNGGATCYMNSVLQQLFLVPGVREDLLSINANAKEEGLFCQLQTVFGYLLESELKYYEPVKFWESFKMHGQPINIREQQDACEFYCKLVEQVDDFLKTKRLDRIFSKRFQGTLAIQKRCKDCPHRFEREQTFMTLDLTVKRQESLLTSLDQFVKGEMLEGDNAVNCDTCVKKVKAVMQTSIKALPQVLVMQLKRFGYDYDRGRAMKYDDYFKFPRKLDMSPYTTEYQDELNRGTKRSNNAADKRRRCPKQVPDIIPVSISEAAATAQSNCPEDIEMYSPESKASTSTTSNNSDTDSNRAVPGTPKLLRNDNKKNNKSFQKSSTPPLSPSLSDSLVEEAEPFLTPPQPTRKRGPSSHIKQEIYELVGVVVHSGQAAAGHYYSFIKDRRGDTLTNPNKGQWFKFNDITVESVEMSDDMLEHECFGGSYKVHSSTLNGLPESRERYWSAYMLFYERCDSHAHLSGARRNTASVPKSKAHSSRSLRFTNSARRTLNLTTPLSHTLDGSKDDDDENSSNTSVQSSQSHRASEQVLMKHMSEDRGRNYYAASSRSSLSELRELLEEGERRGIFSTETLPARLLSAISHQNLQLYRNAELYHECYYKFLHQLCGIYSNQDEDEQCSDQKLALDDSAIHEVTTLALSFYFNTYLRLKVRPDELCNDWCKTITNMITRSSSACTATFQFFASNEKNKYQHLQQLLLCCNERIPRSRCSEIIIALLRQVMKTNEADGSPPVIVKELLTQMLLMLKDAVPTNLQRSEEYFNIIYEFCSIHKSYCHEFLLLGGSSHLLNFLLGDAPADILEQIESSPSSVVPAGNRWNSLQTQPFIALHRTIALLILSVDLSQTQTEKQMQERDDESMASITESPRADEEVERASSMASIDDEVNTKSATPPTDEQQLCMNVSSAEDSRRSGGSTSNNTGCSGMSHHPDCVTCWGGEGSLCNCYLASISGNSSSLASIPPPLSIKALVTGDAYSEVWLNNLMPFIGTVSSVFDKVTDALFYACHDNKLFSALLLTTLMDQLDKTPYSSMRVFAKLIMELVVIDDRLHSYRVSVILEGAIKADDTKAESLLDMISKFHESDVRRAYLIMKLLVTLASKNRLTRHVLSEVGPPWVWAVEWLRDILTLNTYEAAAHHSNEGKHSNVFERTTSATLTLEEANRLLDQMSPVAMETEEEEDEQEEDDGDAFEIGDDDSS